MDPEISAPAPPKIIRLGMIFMSATPIATTPEPISELYRLLGITPPKEELKDII